MINKHKTGLEILKNFIHFLYLSVSKSTLLNEHRAYRMGQKRDVHVYRLISSGCIEENIYLRQIYKTHLSLECVEDGDAKRLFRMSANNKHGEFLGIENLFDLKEAGSGQCKTREILQVCV